MSKVAILLGVLVFFAVLGGTIPLNNVYGLSCDLVNTTESLKYADAVFYGKAFSKEYLPSEHDKKRQDVIVQFSVIESFKGVTEHQVGVISEEWLWGFNFTEGIEYVVFAGKNNNGALRYQECSPTGTLEYVDIDELRDVSQQYITPPLQQLAAGITIYEIKCKENLTLLKKTSNDLPICVSIKTGQKLLERKWAQPMAVTAPLESMQKSDSYQREITILSITPQNVTLPEHKNQTQKMYKLPGGGYFIPE